MNTADRELMQQALDAMRDAAYDEEGYTLDADLAEAHDALRERLAHCDRCGKKLGGEGDIHTCTPDPIGDAQSALIAEMAAQPEQEPVIFCMHWEDRWGVNHYVDPKEPHPAQAKPLYTTPPAPAAPKSAEWAKFLHYPDCWDTAAYPTLSHAVHETLACFDCGTCTPPPAALTQEPVSMRMPKAGDKVICLEDESLATVVSLTAGGSPDIVFSDGSRGTYLLHEFAELFGYATPPAAQRTWVELTPEEIDKTHETQVWDARRSFARAIEAKLKEKNT